MRLPLAAFCSLALVAGLPAAAVAAVVQGRVIDAQGLALPGADVTLRRAATGLRLSETSDADGRFEFAGLESGSYTLSASAPGFSAETRDLALGDQSASFELRLQPGSFAENLTVSARLAASPEGTRRIPGSFELLDRETLERARVHDVSEALRKVSGLNVRDEEGLGLRPNVGVRGQNPTRSTRVLLLEDGVPVSYAPYGDNASYSHPPVERFEEVEVLKGSGQIAYGPVTVGAVINYLTPAPPEAPEGRLLLAGGSRGYVNGHGRFGGTFGGTGLLFDYLHKQGRGARANVDTRIEDLDLKLERSLRPRERLSFKAAWQHEDSDITYSGLTQAEYDQDPRQNPFVNDVFASDRLTGVLAHTRSFERAVLTTRLYGLGFSRDWWRQSSNSAQRPNDRSDPKCGGMENLGTSCGNEGRLRDYQQVGLEPRLLLDHRGLGGRGVLEAGARAHLERQDRLQKNGDTPTARDGVLVEDNQRDNEAYSTFLREQLSFGRLTLTPGLRLEHVRYRRENRLNDTLGRTALTEWIPGAGVAFAPRSDTTIFAGIHRGFAPPATSDIIHNAGGVVELDPERSWELELGVRSLLRPGVRLDATLFRIDYQSQVIPASLAGGIGATLTNAGATLHEGLEAGLRLDLGTLRGSAHDPYLRAALTWLPTARFTGTRMSAVPGFSAVSVSDNRLPYAPEVLLTASAGYRYGSRLDAVVELVHIGAQFGDDLNTRISTPDGQRGLIAASTVWNATLNLELRRFRSVLFVTGKNLLDRVYVVDRSRGLLPGNPRLIQAGVTTRF